MNKNLLLTTCLIFVAIIGFGCVSAADTNNNTMTDAPTHVVEQQNTNTLKNCDISTEKIVKENDNLENNTGRVNDNTNTTRIITSKNMTLQNYESSINAQTNNSNTPKLNITGPKTNGSTLNIKGPKITGNGPKITLSQMDKDIYHFAKVFLDNPHWDIYDCFDYVKFHTSYNIHDTSKIVAQAYHIALKNYHGDEYMYPDWQITPEFVEYNVRKYHNWK